jgi:serine/threonine protein kinase
METRPLCSRYKLCEKIGAGTFGEVYSAEDLHTHEFVAVKLESSTRPFSQLALESNIYSILSDCVNIPKAHFYGEDRKYHLLVMDLLGSSLDSLFTSCHRHFSLKTVLMIADQMLTALETVHNRHFVHCDVKPANFVFDRAGRQLFLIDFGLSRRYRDPITLEHIPYSDGQSLIGTTRYASLRVMYGVEPTRRDDLESLGYALCYFLRGNLPWMGIKMPTIEMKQARIRSLKKRITAKELCAGLPSEFQWFMESVRKLKFAERPGYAEYRARFRELFLTSEFVFDYRFDWAIANKRANQKKSQRTAVLVEGNRAVLRKVPIIDNPRLVPPVEGNRKMTERGKQERGWKMKIQSS